MSYNYNAVLDQIISLGKFGQQAFKSGQLNLEQKKKLRDEIFGFRERAEKEGISVSESVEISRKILESYVHDYADPRQIPDYFMDHLDDIKQLIQAVDKEQRSGNQDYDFVEILHVLTDRFIRVASKVLRISFEVRNPPMQLPSPNDLYVPKQNTVLDAFK